LRPQTGPFEKENEDASLTLHGIRQCVDLELALKLSKNVEALFVSPLRRTIQTATFSFPNLVGQIPWLAHEMLRERVGLYPCNRRRPISESSKFFPHIDFSNIEHDHDQISACLDEKDSTSNRETPDQVIERGRNFFEWLSKRPEKEVIVVSHGGFLYRIFGEILETNHDYKDNIFSTREIRSYILKFQN
jgi:broad specificity phosphatase PhoE